VTGRRGRTIVVGALLTLLAIVAALVRYWSQHDGSLLLRSALLVIAVAAILDQVLLRTVTRPVAKVMLAAQRFGHGHLEERIPVRTASPFGDLAASFNAMADQLSDTLQDLHESQTLQHRFVADVSHELRTPLAAMLAANDGLDSVDGPTRDRSVELLREQTRRLATLVDDLLEMSRFDAGQAGTLTEHLDLAALADDVLRTVALGLDARVTAIGDTTADVDVRRIHTVLRNLVTNAFEHGEPPVDVIIDGRDPDTLIMTVADDGPGVPDPLRAAIFDRFVRADAARTTSRTHSGLGLAIALENARLHGATLTLAASGRTAFTLELPRSNLVP